MPLAPVRADPKLSAVANSAIDEPAPLPALTIAQGITPAEVETEGVEIYVSEFDDINFIKAKLGKFLMLLGISSAVLVTSL